MRTELLLYKSNVLKNWNFKNANSTIDGDTLTQINYWELNDLWTLLNGQAICINSDGSLLEQFNILRNQDYKVTINIDSLTDYIILNVGTTATLITTAGVHSFNVNSGTGDSISVLCSNGFDVTINWIQLVETPNVLSVDKVNDISIPITFSIADIRDISKRNASFTKTIDIPGSTNNNQIFNQIFEIDGDCNFNPNKKIKAILYYDGEEQLNGYLQLKKINRNQNGFNNYDLISYNVTIVGGVTDIFKDMGETLLSELGYDEYTHTYNATTQELSWNDSITKNGGYFQNWVNGFSKPATDVAIDSDGRVIVNFAIAHGFQKNDQVYVNFSDTTAIGYNGDQRVFEVLSSTSIKLYFPFITNSGVLAGPTGDFVFKHEPTGDGYVYPMIFQGLHADQTGHNGINWYIRDFIPAVYLKTYLNKIQERFGYTFISNLFDSVNFKRLIMNAAIKDFKQSYAQLNHNAFQAGLSSTIDTIIPLENRGTYSLGPPPTYLYRKTGLNAPYSYNQYPVFDDDFTLPNFDNSNSYSTITGKWSPVVTAQYKLNTNISMTYDFTLPAGHTINTGVTSANDLKMTVQIIDFTTMTSLGSNFVTVEPVIQGNTFTISTSVQSIEFQGVIGHNYGVEVNIYFDFLPVKTALTPVPFDMNIHIETNSLFFNEPIATSYAENATVDLVSAIPKMTCKDFLITLIKMFNLYIEPDKNNSKVLYIEPRNDYYTNNIIDWTDKLDLNETIELQPMAELNAKTYEYKFKDDEAALNKEHKAGAGFGYGDKIKTVDNDFLTSKNTTEIPTSSGVLLDIPVNSDKIITGIYGSDGSALSRIDGNPRILYFGMAATSTPWQHLSQTGGTSFTNRKLYPYAGHLDKVRGPKFDFNFGYPVDIFYTSDQWTSANLYNLYYRDMINELTSRNNKLVTASLYLKASDISKLSFKDTYFIDGHHLRLNKITDYVPGSVKSIKCEFTRVEILNSFTNTHMRYNGKTFVNNYLDGEKLPSIRNLYNSNSLLNRTIRDYGDSNNINLTGSSNILVKGNNNTIGQQSTNISIIDSDNVFIYGGLSNVTVIGTSNITITQSNTTVVNGLTINNGVIQNTTINFISAGVDEVLNPFNNYTSVNLINAGKDQVLSIGSVNTINTINAGKDSIL